MIMKSDINKFVCILFVTLSSISLENFKDRALIIPEILELIKLHTYKFGLVYICLSVCLSTDEIYITLRKISVLSQTHIYIYEGCPKMPYNCIILLKFKISISLYHMHPVGNLFLDILLKLHKIS